MVMSAKVGIVGTGFIAPIHLEALRRLRVPVHGIASSSKEKSQQAAKRLGLSVGYASFQDLIADPEIDIVHIASPNRLHYDQAATALRAGKHVLCEKPLAMNTRETADLVRLAASSGRAAGVCYNVRYYPLCIEAAQRTRQGTLGPLYHITGSYAQDWLLNPTDFNWRVLSEDGGELRAVGDIGTHWLDLAQFVTGRRIEAVCADLKTALPVRYRPRSGVETFGGKLATAAEAEPIGIQTEDYGCIMLRFEGGASGAVWVSQVAAGRKNCLRFEVAGAVQSLAWNSESPNELWIGNRERANEMLIRDPALMSEPARRYADYPGGHNEGFPDTFKQLFKAFYDYITVGDLNAPPPFPTFADGHHEMLICEAVLRSAREQRWVRIAEID